MVELWFSTKIISSCAVSCWHRYTSSAQMLDWNVVIWRHLRFCEWQDRKLLENAPWGSLFRHCFLIIGRLSGVATYRICGSWTDSPELAQWVFGQWADELHSLPHQKDCCHCCRSLLHTSRFVSNSHTIVCMFHLRIAGSPSASALRVRFWHSPL